MSDCQNDCLPPDVFPRPIDNRPGLKHIDYRIGSYAELRAHMLLALDRAPALRQWTHRLADDPGIALIEAAAEVGDILTLYHELYANEAWLRTAQWRDSVAALVRLTGHRLMPGLGGRARFAFAAKGERPVTIPAGLAVKAQLESEAAPAVFETSTACVAHPALSQFHLYRPRHLPSIHYGTSVFTLAGSANVTLKPGDRVMVGLERPAAGGLAYDHAQILMVARVEQKFGSTVVAMQAGITMLTQPKMLPGALSGFAFSGFQQILPTTTIGSLLTGLFSLSSMEEQPVASASKLRAWKLGATHRHFGHNAPPQQIKVSPPGHVTQADTEYQRNLGTRTGGDGRPELRANELPLEGEVKSLIAGARVLIEGALSAGLTSSHTKLPIGPTKRLLARRIAQIERHSLAWGDLSGASTVATLEDPLATTEDGVSLDVADIRDLSIYEVVGDGFDLYSDFANDSDSRGKVLHFYGDSSLASALEQRALLFMQADGAVTPVRVLSAETAAIDSHQQGFYRLHLDQELEYARFPYSDPTVSVYGNLVEATQGKTETQVTLGDGDARAVFQSFAVPKTPLTYLLDTTQVPPQLAQLEIWVDGVEWTRVDSLYGRGPRERVYIVREDDGGKSWVQFGDGKTGARLKSGRGNVVAAYRSGSGADGVAKADAKPQLDKKMPGLDAAFLFEPVTGGAQPETSECARSVAPRRMQSLGRIVSLPDYEAEALAIPGVTKARAAWTTLDGVPTVRVAILTQSRSQADADAAAEALRAAVRARGAGRSPLRVAIGSRSAVALNLTVGLDSRRRAEDIKPAIYVALGVDSSERGLFGEASRQFGEDVHGSQIVAAVQNVTGVSWVRLTRLTPALRSLTALSFTILPKLGYLPPTQRALVCPDDSLLTLASADLELALSAADGADGAAS